MTGLRTYFATAAALLFGLPPLIDTIVPIMPPTIAKRFVAASAIAAALAGLFAKLAVVKLDGELVAESDEPEAER